MGRQLEGGMFGTGFGKLTLDSVQHSNPGRCCCCHTPTDPCPALVLKGRSLGLGAPDPNPDPVILKGRTLVTEG